MPSKPNPDTHCPECHEPLSEFGHCWQHHWPPMDPAQDAVPTPLIAYQQQVATELRKLLKTAQEVFDSGDTMCPLRPIEIKQAAGRLGIDLANPSPSTAAAIPTNG